MSPGVIATPVFAKLGVPVAALDDFRADLATRIPLGRLGSDDDVARTVAFLASPAAGFITGADIVVDGGMFAAVSVSVAEPLCHPRPCPSRTVSSNRV